MTAVPDITLHNGVAIPQLGFGVFQVKPEETVAAVTTALEVGYRHIDTAAMYGNEAEVGEAIRRSGLDPADVFVTSKLNNNAHAYDDALAAFDETHAKIGKEQLDLYLVHWPLPTVSDYVETWQAMEKIAASGRVRAIGVSNFQPAHLERLAEHCQEVPAVNQIEIHPYLTQEPLRRYDEEHGIATESWSPIAQGGVLDDPVITTIAESTGKTAAQVVLRWHVQLGLIIFPKSVTPSRIRENFDIFDFSLSEDDMAAISRLNKDQRTGPDPDVFAMVPPRH